MNRGDRFLEEVGRYTKYLSVPSLVYSVNISLMHKYIYVETPKAGCSTIKSFLIRSELNENRSFEDFEHIHFRQFSPLLNPMQVNFPKLLADPTFFKFCFVRNPYTRLLSAYLDKIARETPQKLQLLNQLGLGGNPNQNLSFSEFVECVIAQPVRLMDHHWRIQYYQTLQDQIKYDFIGKTETLDRDLSYVAEQLKLKSNFFEPELRNSTNALSKIIQYYDVNLKSKIYKKYEIDFIHFGYSSDLIAV